MERERKKDIITEKKGKEQGNIKRGEKERRLYNIKEQKEENTWNWWRKKIEEKSSEKKRRGSKKRIGRVDEEKEEEDYTEKYEDKLRVSKYCLLPFADLIS